MEDLQQIKKTINNYFGVNIDTKIRIRDIVLPRQIAHYLAKKHTKHSLSVIGAELGSQQHCTVLYSDKVIKDQLTYDKKLNEKINDIEAKILFKFKHIKYVKRNTKNHEIADMLNDNNISLNIQKDGYIFTLHSDMSYNYIRLFNHELTKIRV